MQVDQVVLVHCYSKEYREVTHKKEPPNLNFVWAPAPSRFYTVFPVERFQSGILKLWVGAVLKMFLKEGIGKQVAVVEGGVENLYRYFIESLDTLAVNRNRLSHRCALQKRLSGSSWPAQLPRSDLILKPSPAPLMWVKLFSSCLFRSCLFFT